PTESDCEAVSVAYTCLTDTFSVPPTEKDCVPTDHASFPTVWVVMLFATVVVLLLPADHAMCCLPPPSSKCIEFWDPPPGELAVARLVTVLFAGSAKGGACLALYARPTIIGRSGSPSSKATSTSHPTRGMSSEPGRFGWATRTGRLLV